MESFDHVKKELKIEEEGEAEKDPAFFLKTEGLSEDMKTRHGQALHPRRPQGKPPARLLP